MGLVGKFFNGQPMLEPPEGDAGRGLVVSGAVLWKVYGWSLLLTAVVALFAHEAISSAWSAHANDIGWFAFLLLPHMAAVLYGAMWTVDWLLMVFITLAFIGFLAFVNEAPKSVPRQHSHGDYVHSHKYDHALTHYHDDRTDRVYYR
jgi:hypothetical protein